MGMGGIDRMGGMGDVGRMAGMGGGIAYKERAGAIAGMGGMDRMSQEAAAYGHAMNMANGMY